MRDVYDGLRLRITQEFEDEVVKRDSIYYQIFKRFPGLLFELIDVPPPQAQNYRTDILHQLQ